MVFPMFNSNTKYIIIHQKSDSNKIKGIIGEFTNIPCLCLHPKCNYSKLTIMPSALIRFLQQMCSVGVVGDLLF